MSGGGTPQDNSVQLEQQKENYATQQQKIQDAKDAAEKTRLANLRTAAMNTGRSNAENYFQQQGVDPSNYMSAINDIINNISGGISTTDTNPGGYYKDVGATAYDQAQTAARTAAERGLDPIFTSNFDYTRIPENYADPTVGAIDAEQRQTAEQYLNNLRARGVITSGGYAAGEKNLDTQNAGVMARLNELASGALETGRQDLRDVAGRAHTAADTLKLGTTFDPNTYGSQLDSAFMNFVNNLGTTIRGKVGTSNLFDTSGLAAISGAAQGAGNAQTFDPNALAGIFTDNTDNPDNTNANRTNTSTGVF